MVEWKKMREVVFFTPSPVASFWRGDLGLFHQQERLRLGRLVLFELHV